MADTRRQDVEVERLVKAHNFKAAFKKIDGYIAKQAANKSHWLAVKTWVRSSQPSESERLAVLRSIKEMVDAMTAARTGLKDLADVELYAKSLYEYTHVNPDFGVVLLLGQLRFLSVRTTPKDEEMGKQCFEACVALEDYKNAQQIASILEGTFQKNRQYAFWNITSLWLRSTGRGIYSLPAWNRGVTPADVASYGKLALAKINKLATATSEAKNSTSLPARAVHTSQELLLLDEIVSKVGTAENRLKNFRDPALGPESNVARGDWQLWIRYIDTLTDEGCWQELFDKTSDLLRRARMRNKLGQITEAHLADWKVWTAYVTSALKLGTCEALGAVPEEIQTHLDDPVLTIDYKPWRRNAALAKIRFRFDRPDSLDSTIEPSRWMILHDHFSMPEDFSYGAYPSAYNDLRPFIERLDASERLALHKSMVDHCRAAGYEPDDIREQQDSKVTYQSVLQKVDLASLKFSDINNSSLELDISSRTMRTVNAQKMIFLMRISLSEDENAAKIAVNSAAANISTLDINTEEAKCDKESAKQIIPTITCSWAGCERPCTTKYCGHCLETIARHTISEYATVLKLEQEGKGITVPSTDRHPADDFCTLAAMCLIKLSVSQPEHTAHSGLSYRTSYLLKAAMLLEFAYSRSPANTDFLFLLIRIYAALGCATSVVESFQRIGAKQVQKDTLAYLWLDRVSRFHPLEFDNSELRSPLQHIEELQDFYPVARNQILKNRWRAFEHGSYDSVLQFEKVTHELSATSSCADAAIQRARIYRIMQTEDPDIEGDVCLTQEYFNDTNDYEVFPDFESSACRFFHRVKLVPQPANTLIKANRLSERLSTLTDFKFSVAYHGVPEALKNALSELNKDFVHLAPAVLRDLSLTSSERHSFAIHVILSEIINPENSLTPDWDFDHQVAQICDQLSKLAVAVVHLRSAATLPFGCVLHVLYDANELGSIVCQIVEWLKNQKQVVVTTTAEGLRELTHHALAFTRAVVTTAKEVKKNVAESLIDPVIECTLNRTETEDPYGFPKPDPRVAEKLAEMLGEGFMEEWAGRVVESWREVVGGLSRLKEPYAVKDSR